MKGYKAFNKDLTCIDYQYELDKTHVFDGEPKLCKKGFHFCTNLQDVLKYYCNYSMRIFEIEANGIITEVEDGCSKRACSEIKLIRELSLSEVAKSITDSELAYIWARDIGNRDIMINKIVDSNNAFLWGFHIGDRDIMINRINDSANAYKWAKYIGNQNIMIDRVTDSDYAYFWAIEIGSKNIMIDRIKDYLDVYNWLIKWPEDKQYFIDKGLIQ